jgi:hypothetical protein
MKGFAVRFQATDLEPESEVGRHLFDLDVQHYLGVDAERGNPDQHNPDIEGSHGVVGGEGLLFVFESGFNLAMMMGRSSPLPALANALLRSLLVVAVDNVCDVVSTNGISFQGVTMLCPSRMREAA